MCRVLERVSPPPGTYIELYGDVSYERPLVRVLGSLCELVVPKTRIAQSEHNVSPFATVEGVAN